MKIKIISAGVILCLLAGAVYLQSPVQPGYEPKSSEDTGTTITAKPSSDKGYVVANDETPSSPPRQISMEESAPAPNTYASKPKRLAQRTVIINNKEYPLRTYQPLALPNDPMVGQWWVSNTKLDQAWDVPRGPRQTLLAIIDTGFALKHEEFSANRWYINPGESGTASSEQISSRNCTDRGLALNATCNLIDDDSDGIIDNESGIVAYQNPSRLNCSDQSKPLDRSCNRIDDDGNGHIDDTQGWDFVNNDNSAQAGELNPSGTGTAHGTLVAGVAAATGNNNKGLAGADWGTKILPIQAIDDDSYGDTLSVGRAIYYAAAQGADVISLSLGSYFSDDYVQEAVHAAIASGSIVVAASGNDGCDCIVYPANYPEVIAVGATDSSGGRASFSSWGSNLDIVAPGDQIATSTWSSGNQTSAYASNAAGTSFATPLVSGLLTRLLSYQENISPLQLIAALTENTNRLNIPASVNRDSKLGFGSLDALKGTSRMSTARDTSLLYAFHPISRGNALTPTSEVIEQYSVHNCPDGINGTTPIYELIKGSSRIFSISPSETSTAAKAGYSSTVFAYACLQQPHDAASFVRSINMFSEFRNIFRPLQ